MKITEEEISLEKLRMSYEKLRTGRILLVVNGESEDFWRRERHKAGNRWWKFWKNKSDFQIITAGEVGENES